MGPLPLPCSGFGLIRPTIAPCTTKSSRRVLDGAPTAVPPSRGTAVRRAQQPDQHAHTNTARTFVDASHNSLLPGDSLNTGAVTSASFPRRRPRLEPSCRRAGNRVRSEPAVRHSELPRTRWLPPAGREHRETISGAITFVVLGGNGMVVGNHGGANSAARQPDPNYCPQTATSADRSLHPGRRWSHTWPRHRRPEPAPMRSWRPDPPVRADGDRQAGRRRGARRLVPRLAVAGTENGLRELPQFARHATPSMAATRQSRTR